MEVSVPISTRQLLSRGDWRRYCKHNRSRSIGVALPLELTWYEMPMNARLLPRLSRVWFSAGMHNVLTSHLNPRRCCTPSLYGAILDGGFNFRRGLLRLVSTNHIHKNSTKRKVIGPVTRTVLLVDETGQNRGEMSLKEAIAIADYESLELVEVKAATTSSSSVFKLMTSKALFDESVRKKKQQKNHSPKVKEIVITGRIAPQDLQWKVKRMREFLQASHPVKLAVTHTSRKATSMDDKLKLIEKIQEDVKEFGTLDSKPKAAGNFRVNCMFKSIPKKWKKIVSTVSLEVAIIWVGLSWRLILSVMEYIQYVALIWRRTNCRNSSFHSLINF